MATRRTYFRISFGTLAAIVLVAAGIALWLFRSEGGRARLASTIVNAANNAFDGRGRLVIGSVRSANPSSIDLRDVQLVDTLGVPILTVAQVRATLAVRPFFSKAVRIRELQLDTVALDLRKDFVGPFNLQWLLTGDPSKPPAPPRALRIGDDVLIDRVVMREAKIVVTLPWEPHPLWVGAERDSITALRDSLHELVRVPGGIVEIRRFDIGRLVGRDLYAITPDDAPGALTIDSATLVVSDPPVRVRDLGGEVKWYDDSLTFRASRVLLPDSKLAAGGMVSWYRPGPVQYDVAISAPDVALADINWTWPVLPESGRGSANVRMRTLANPDHLEIAITDLKARAMESSVAGNITLVVEPRDFLLRDVALAFEPMTTALAARLTEDVLPPELDGSFTGRFVAKAGGSLNALRIDSLLLAFDDATTPGARSRVSANGVVAIGVNPTARDVRFSNLSVDLRTVRTIVPDLPDAVNGMITGNGRVASASLDAADVRDLTLQWTDDAGHVSTVTGRSAARWNTRTTTVDLALGFSPFDVQSLARWDTAFAGRGMLRGTVEAKGALDSLPFSVMLTQVDDGAGTLNATGWLGATTNAADSLDWRTDVALTMDSVNAERWLRAGMAPVTRVGGTLNVFARGSGGTTDTARITAAFMQPAAETRTPFSLFGAGSWGAEALSVDSLRAVAPGFVFEGDGGLARDSGDRATFRGSLRMDSLRLVRAELPRLAGMIAEVDTVLANTVRGYAADSLSGDLNLSAYGEGSFADYLTSVAVAGNQVRVGEIVVGRLFGSARADNLPGEASFVVAATADSVEGFGALSIATANFGVDDATSKAGALRFDLVARDTSRLRMRGQFARGDDTLLVRTDSVRFSYANVVWTNPRPLILRDRADGFSIDSFSLLSNQGGSLQLGAQVPLTDPISAYLRLDQFPAGEVAAFALGTERLPGLMSGAAELSGVRRDPRITADFQVDSLGSASASLSGVRVQAGYAEQQLDLSASVSDTMGRSLRGDVRLPADLRLQSVVGERIYTEELNGAIVADSVRLRDLPVRLADIRNLDAFVSGRFTLGGTFDAPSFEGGMKLEGGTLFSDILGIRPTGATLDFVAGGDSLHVERFRFQSGPRASDTLHLTATVRRPLRDNPAVTLRGYLNNVQLANQRDGTILDLAGSFQLGGNLPRPTVSANLFVPRATLVLDLTQARTVLDLNSPEARALLAEDELPVVLTAGDQFTSLGEYLEARDVRVRLGDEVWVRTREATVKLAGDVTVLQADGQRLSLDGEVQVERGTYRLDLGVVNRPFAVDSGRVRFFPQDTLNPSLDVRARHVVRGVDGRDVAIDVTIGGKLENPTLRLSSQDDAYAQAPESELISLLVFGAPTFALDRQSQQTVRAVTGLIVPTLSGFAEGTLQRLLPVFNTVQVSSAGGQSSEELGVLSLLDNLSVTAGKQLGTQTYLRLDTGVCRSVSTDAARRLNLWYGVAIEYRFKPGLTGQVGVDPGPSPCSGQGGLAASRRMQVGFDLFKEWVF